MRPGGEHPRQEPSGPRKLAAPGRFEAAVQIEGLKLVSEALGFSPEITRSSSLGPCERAKGGDVVSWRGAGAVWMSAISGPRRANSTSIFSPQPGAGD